MSWLRRERAPWSDDVWNRIDEAVTGTARHFMAARHVADFDGPHGWEFVAVRLGTTSQSPLENASTRAQVATPQVVMLAEIQCSFYLPFSNLEVWERGGPAFDTGPAEEAAREVAHAEDQLAFYGGAGSTGFLSSSRSPRIAIGDWANPSQLVSDVLNGVAKLDAAGIAGPYTLVLDEAHYYTYHAAGVNGFPVAKQLKSVIHRVVRSQVIRGGGIFSTRGGDFIVTVGGDLSVGYVGYDSKNVQLFVIESLAAQLITPEAVCVLTTE